MEKKGKIIAVCISQRTGEQKKPVTQAEVRADHGLIGDAHAGTDRQVSLLAQESIDKVRAKGVEASPGDFAENLVVSGLDLASLPVGTKLRIGDQIELEVTQIGKECHSPCAIYRKAGMCVMPSEGVFARALAGGWVKPGDVIQVEDADEGGHPDN